MIKDKDPNALWLDPRFDSNPAFLADEAEELQKENSNANDEKRIGSIHVATFPPAT